jgi:hypothetical protein
MRKVTRIVVAALFLQFFVGGVSAEAATRISIAQVVPIGQTATISWTAPKLPVKKSFIVSLVNVTKKTPAKTIITTSTRIGIALDAFSQYYIQISSKQLPKSQWSTKRYFWINSNAPVNLKTSSIGYTGMTLGWDALPGVTSYEVVYDNVAKVTTTNSIVVSGLSVARSTDFYVRGISGGKRGDISNKFTAATLEAGPEKLAASSITKSGFTLTWQPVTGADGYNIYKSGKLLETTKLLSYSVANLTPGSTGTYTVAATFGKSETTVSNQVSVSTLVETPTKPTISSITSQTATVNWTLDTNADSYEVNLYDSSGTNLVRSTKVAGSLSSTVLSGLTNSTVYTVGLKINYPESVSKESALASFTTLKPTMTGQAVSSITTTSITLSWSSLNVASTYEVFRDNVVIATGIAASVGSYVFTSLAAGQTYKLGVRASFVDGTKGTGFTEIVEVTATAAIDPAFRPVVSTLPVITLPYANVPIIGATLTVNNGTWTSTPGISSYSYQWQRSLDSGSTWSDLAGATSSSYVVNVADNSYLLRARVSATNVNGTGIATTVATGIVASVYNIQVPIVRGNAVLGQVLEVSDGAWSSVYGITLSYRWITSRTGTFISGQTAPSYTVGSTEVGHSISAQVTASTSHGSLGVTSPTRGIVTSVGNTALPVVTGTLRVGGTLAVSTGTWLNLESDTTPSYQWQSSTDGVLWNNITGANSATYVLQLGQAGLFIRAQVFQTKSGFTAVLANSAATSIVPALNLTNTIAPAVTGAWTVGTSISASTGTWSTSGTYTYQWQSSSDNLTWSDIASATSSSYTLTSSEATKYVRVQVINTSSVGAGVAYSVARSKVGAPFNTALPLITGTIKVGSTQTVSTGTWSNTPTAYSYQWQKSADGISWINLSGETASTYIPTFDVANLQIRVSVGAGNAVETATVTTAIVSGFLPPQATAIPTISGTTTALQTLASTSGTWPGGTEGSYVYQWQRSSDSGVTWTNISGATASTYALVAGDAGYQIRSQVSLTTNTGSSSAYSLPTVAVAPPPA